MREPPSALPLQARALGFSAGGVAILRDVCLTIAAGGPTLVLGPNGAGKSVLLRLLHGLLAPTEGAVQWADRGVRQAMVMQRPVMLRRSVLANVLYPLPGSRADRRERAMEALNRVGMAPLAARPARRLSGGEQQLVALARAWAQGPEVLFLDEPTSSLAPGAARAVERFVAAIAAEGTKIVMTSHDIPQARRLAGEVIFLAAGRIAEQTPAGTFFTAPRSVQAAAFLRGDLPH